MNDMETKERFIELRAEGRSYADIAAALNVSKPTLIAWGKELQKEVANARTLRLDALFEKYAVAKGKRVEAFGKRLDGILAELDTRNLANVPTATLLKLALDYGDRLKAEAEPLTMQGEDRPFDMDAVLSTTRETWPA
jgi:DNA-binding XRE family transcriptional regulator